MRSMTLSADPMDVQRMTLPEISTSSSSLHMTYRFAHDKVQQAAAQLISQEDRKIVHGKIAEVSCHEPSYIIIPLICFHDHMQKLLSRFAKDAKGDFSDYLLRIATHMNQRYLLSSAYSLKQITEI